MFSVWVCHLSLSKLLLKGPWAWQAFDLHKLARWNLLWRTSGKHDTFVQFKGHGPAFPMVAKWQRHSVAKLCRAVALHQSQWRLQRRPIWAWPKLIESYWIPPVGMIHGSRNRTPAKLQILINAFSWCEFAKNAADCNGWGNCVPVGQRKCKVERLGTVLGASALTSELIAAAPCLWMELEASGS